MIEYIKDKIYLKRAYRERTKGIQGTYQVLQKFYKPALIKLNM